LAAGGRSQTDVPPHRDGCVCSLAVAAHRKMYETDDMILRLGRMGAIWRGEGGLYAPDYIDRANSVIMGRKLLPNEVRIDVAGKSSEQVLQEAVGIIDRFESLRDYSYELDDERNYLSWVRSRGLY